MSSNSASWKKRASTNVASNDMVSTSETTLLLADGDTLGVHQSFNKSLLKAPEDEDFGGEKDISYIGGVALLTNNITGPGLILAPYLFQQAGYITPMVAILFCMVCSAFASTMLCQAMARVPGNDHFQGRIEFATLAKLLLPYWGYMVTIILLIVSLMTQLVSSIIISAQVMDLALIAIFGRTFAVEIVPHPARWIVVENPGTTFSPFGNVWVLSLGFLVILLATLPLGFLHLDDNIIVQKGAISCLCVIFVEWFITFFVHGLDFGRVPLWGTNQSQVLGTIIFNYAFVITVPSWVNEKRQEVSVNKSVWAATTMATIFYLAAGLFGAWSFNYFKGREDLLNAINNASGTGVLRVMSKVSVYVFPAVALMSSIPVFSIIIRYNLIENHICRKSAANFWSVVFPWIVSIAFYAGTGLEDVVNDTSLLVNGFINFGIPMMLFVISLKKPELPPILIAADPHLADNVETFSALPGASPRVLIGLAMTFTILITLLVTVALVILILSFF